MKVRLNIVTLGVKNLQKSSEFYQKALGWKPTKDSDDKIVFFNHHGIILGLYPLDKLAEDANISAERNGFSGVTLAINLDKKEKVHEETGLSSEEVEKIREAILIENAKFASICFSAVASFALKIGSGKKQFSIMRRYLL